MLGRFSAPAAASLENSQAFTTAGAHTFTVPDGVFQITLSVWGPGGGGGGGSGGGGGGYYLNSSSGSGTPDPGDPGALGADGGDPTADTVVTRDTNGFTYTATKGSKGFRATKEGAGGYAPEMIDGWTVENYPEYAGTGVASAGAAGTGTWSDGVAGQSGGDGALTGFTPTAGVIGGDFYEACDTAFPPGVGGAADGPSFNGVTHGQGGKGGDGGRGGRGFDGGPDEAGERGGPGAPGGGGSSGGSGGLTVKTLSVSPGETFSFTVPAGGSGGSGGSGGAHGTMDSGGQSPQDGDPGEAGADGGVGAVVFWW